MQQYMEPITINAYNIIRIKWIDMTTSITHIVDEFGRMCITHVLTPKMIQLVCDLGEELRHDITSHHTEFVMDLFVAFTQIQLAGTESKQCEIIVMEVFSGILELFETSIDNTTDKNNNAMLSCIGMLTMILCRYKWRDEPMLIRLIQVIGKWICAHPIHTDNTDDQVTQLQYAVKRLFVDIIETIYDHTTDHPLLFYNKMVLTPMWLECQTRTLTLFAYIAEVGLVMVKNCLTHQTPNLDTTDLIMEIGKYVLCEYVTSLCASETKSPYISLIELVSRVVHAIIGVVVSENDDSTIHKFGSLMMIVQSVAILASQRAPSEAIQLLTLIDMYHNATLIYTKQHCILLSQRATMMTELLAFVADTMTGSAFVQNNKPPPVVSHMLLVLDHTLHQLSDLNQVITKPPAPTLGPKTPTTHFAVLANFPTCGTQKCGKYDYTEITPGYPLWAPIIQLASNINIQPIAYFTAWMEQLITQTDNIGCVFKPDTFAFHMCDILVESIANGHWWPTRGTPNSADITNPTIWNDSSSRIVLRSILFMLVRYMQSIPHQTDGVVIVMYLFDCLFGDNKLHEPPTFVINNELQATIFELLCDELMNPSFQLEDWCIASIGRVIARESLRLTCSLGLISMTCNSAIIKSINKIYHDEDDDDFALRNVAPTLSMIEMAVGYVSRWFLGPQQPTSQLQLQLQSQQQQMTIDDDDVVADHQLPKLHPHGDIIMEQIGMSVCGNPSTIIDNFGQLIIPRADAHHAYITKALISLVVTNPTWTTPILTQIVHNENEDIYHRFLMSHVILRVVIPSNPADLAKIVELVVDIGNQFVKHHELYTPAINSTAFLVAFDSVAIILTHMIEIDIHNSYELSIHKIIEPFIEIMSASFLINNMVLMTHATNNITQILPPILPHYTAHLGVIVSAFSILEWMVANLAANLVVDNHDIMQSLDIFGKLVGETIQGALIYKRITAHYVIKAVDTIRFLNIHSQPDELSEFAHALFATVVDVVLPLSAPLHAGHVGQDEFGLHVIGDIMMLLSITRLIAYSNNQRVVHTDVMTDILRGVVKSCDTITKHIKQLIVDNDQHTLPEPTHPMFYRFITESLGDLRIIQDDNRHTKSQPNKGTHELAVDAHHLKVKKDLCVLILDSLGAAQKICNPASELIGPLDKISAILVELSTDVIQTTIMLPT